MNEGIATLQQLCDTIPARLRAIPEDVFDHKASETKWSKKEILGHLIDSAANNHQRFVRVQFEDAPTIVYDQNNWVAASRYRHMPAEHIISFWEHYNRHIIAVISLMPAEALKRTCLTGSDAPVTAEWLLRDYVRHLNHHLLQILEGQPSADRT